ncbi:MAG: hypothetical protein JWM47_173 [Acidimicrobiales bacterium]|nr:hypothetical protein [Acidimicrobiales bacterium]
MAVLVEFFGLPGSGKSTLAGLVRDEIERNGGAVGRFPKPSAANKLRAAWRYRRTMRSAVRVLLRSPRPVAQRLQAVRFLVVTLARYDAALADASDATYLIEEGSLQRLFLLLVEVTGVRSAQAATLVERAPVADVLVHVTASPDELRRRLHVRSRGVPERLAALTPEQTDALFGEAEEMLRSAARQALARPEGTEAGRPARVLVDGLDSGDLHAVMAHL